MKNTMLKELQQLQLATELIYLGARPQLLETETSISRKRLMKLYKEINGKSPPKGLLPFSVQWYMNWKNNIHSSLYLNFYIFFKYKRKAGRLRSIINAYHMYLEHCPDLVKDKAVLSLMRAWILIRFYESNIIGTVRCYKCDGVFITYAYRPNDRFICVLCAPPSRAIAVRKL